MSSSSTPPDPISARFSRGTGVTFFLNCVVESETMSQQSLDQAEQPGKETVAVAPVESARAAGLRYVSDTSPGIRRRRVGKHFSYIGLDGKPIHDQQELQRIRGLAIPPAWTDVWICSNPRGHIQASGRDARGRKQYRYHSAWRKIRDETKYDRLIAF